MSRQAVAVLLAFALCTSSLVVSAQSHEPRLEPTTAKSVEALDDSIQREMIKGGIVGLAAAVVVDGKVVWRQGYGYADRESGRPFTPQTVMNIASISKTVVGAAMMRAQEQGKLNLDKDISTYLPFEVRNPHHPNSPITLRQLATHTSSVSDRWDWYSKSYHFGRNAPENLGDFLQSYLEPTGANYRPDNFISSAPGSEREYSNVGAGLAAYVVEQVTKQSLDQYTQAQLFAPLGMASTHWRLQPDDLKQGATLYLLQDDIPIAIQPYSMTTWPDGGLRTSVDDLSRFFIALLQGGQVDGVRVLEKKSVDDMLRLQFTPTQKPKNVNVAEKNSGLFWQTKFNTKYVGHGGSDPGLKTEMLATPDLKTGVVLFSNSSGSQTEEPFDAILQLLFSRASSLRVSAEH